MENNWTVHHIAVIVRDMNKAVEYLLSLGIATIKPEHIITKDTLIDLMSFGNLTPFFCILG